MKPLAIDRIPLHAVLVHFPVAGWTAATVLAVLAAAGNGSALAAAALYCNGVALLIGAMAMGAGALDFAALPGKQAIRDQAARHMLLAAGAWTLYLVTALLQVKALPVAAAVTSVVALAVLTGAGHAGARLVYHHGVPWRTGATHD